MARYPWPANAGPYRAVESLRYPWMNSPVIPLPHEYPGPPYTEMSGAMPRDTQKRAKESNRDHREYGRNREQRFWPRIMAFLNPRSGAHRSRPPLNDNSDPSSPPAHRRLKPSDWKSFGYWSRPTVNGVPVHNSTPGFIPPGSVDARFVFQSLRGPHDSPHPERWIPGLQHHSLPPRPSLWQAPQPNSLLPLPWECQVNPFLQHRSIGLTPLYFDLGGGPTGILFSEPEGAVPLEEADRAQPATYPLLTHMHIVAVADDTAPRFPWPVMVHNPDGITCQDVFEALCENFQQHVGQDEYDRWNERQKDRCTRAYNVRIQDANAWNPELSPPIHDGLRRIDYMGDRVMFRGLEPSPDRDPSWIMFVGPA